MKKVIAILLTLVMALSLSVTAFAAGIDDDLSGLAEELENLKSGNEEATVPVITSVDTNNYYEQDLTVGYTYTAAENSAEKVFCVTVEFSLPDDMALTYTGKQNVYTWDHTLGKYVLDADNSTDEEGTLTGEGAFTIKVTNKSNVPVEFDVAYTANTAAVFASGVTDWANNDDVTLATVAAGHEIGTDGISITDVTTATTANTSFASAVCTGKLSVTGINEGKEPTAEGTDTLGTFTVTIAEGAATPAEGDEEEGGEEVTAYQLLANSTLPNSTNKWQNTITPAIPGDLGFYADISNTSRFVFAGSMKLYFDTVFVKKSDGTYFYEEIDGDDDGKVINQYTIIMDGENLAGFDFDYTNTYGDGSEMHAKYRP